jgi:hypothetical protein
LLVHHAARPGPRISHLLLSAKKLPGKAMIGKGVLELILRTKVRRTMQLRTIRRTLHPRKAAVFTGGKIMPRTMIWN